MHALDSDCLTELNITRLNDRTPPSTVTYRVETKLLKHVHDILSSSQKREQLQADEEDCRNSWMMVAMVIDRFLLLVFTLLAIVTSSVLLLNHPTYSDEVSQILDTLGWSRMWHSLYVICCDMRWYAVICYDDLYSTWIFHLNMYILLTWRKSNIRILDTTAFSLNIPKNILQQLFCYCESYLCTLNKIKYGSKDILDT